MENVSLGILGGVLPLGRRTRYNARTMTRTAKLIVVLLVLLIVVGVVGAVLLAGVLKEKPAATAEGAQGAQDAPTPISGVALDRIRKRGELLVIMDTGTPPWIGSPPMYFPNADGQPDGFDYQLAVRIAERVGVPKVKLVHKLYDEFEGALTTNEDYDLVIGGYTPYPAPGIAWSEPYLEYGLCLVVTANSPIQTTDDLVGKSIAIYEDEAAEREVNRLVKGYKKMTKLDSGYWDLLVSGQIDAFLYDYPFAMAEILTWYQQNPHRVGSLRIAQYNLTDSTYAVAVRKADTDLLAAANEAIRAWRDSDAYGEALRRYLSSEDLPESAPAPTGGYTVAAGDTLATIAARQLGGAERWKEIWALNRDRFPNPNLIEVGDTLTMPADAAAR